MSSDFSSDFVCMRCGAKNPRRLTWLGLPWYFCVKHVGVMLSEPFYISGVEYEALVHNPEEATAFLVENAAALSLLQDADWY